MKTTIQKLPSLFGARRLAHGERTTLNALVEQGLRRILSERKRDSGFRLRQVTFKGAGVAISPAPPETRYVS